MNTKKVLDFFVEYARIFLSRKSNFFIFEKWYRISVFEKNRKILDSFIKWARILVLRDYKKNLNFLIKGDRIYILREYKKN